MAATGNVKHKHNLQRASVMSVGLARAGVGDRSCGDTQCSSSPMKLDEQIVKKAAYELSSSVGRDRL